MSSTSTSPTRRSFSARVRRSSFTNPVASSPQPTPHTPAFKSLRALLPFGNTNHNTKNATPPYSTAVANASASASSLPSSSRSPFAGFGSVRRSMTRDRDRDRKASMSNDCLSTPVIAIEREPQQEDAISVRRSVSLPRIEKENNTLLSSEQPEFLTSMFLRTPSPGPPLSVELSTIIEADSSGVSRHSGSVVPTPSDSRESSPPTKVKPIPMTPRGYATPQQKPKSRKPQIIHPPLPSRPDPNDTSSLDLSTTYLTAQVLHAMHHTSPGAWQSTDDAVVIDADPDASFIIDDVKLDALLSGTTTHSQRSASQPQPLSTPSKPRPSFLPRFRIPSNSSTSPTSPGFSSRDSTSNDAVTPTTSTFTINPPGSSTPVKSIPNNRIVSGSGLPARPNPNKQALSSFPTTSSTVSQKPGMLLSRLAPTKGPMSSKSSAPLCSGNSHMTASSPPTSPTTTALNSVSTTPAASTTPIPTTATTTPGVSPSSRPPPLPAPDSTHLVSQDKDATPGKTGLPIPGRLSVSQLVGRFSSPSSGSSPGNPVGGSLAPPFMFNPTPIHPGRHSLNLTTHSRSGSASIGSRTPARQSIDAPPTPQLSQLTQPQSQPEPQSQVSIQQSESTDAQPETGDTTFVIHGDESMLDIEDPGVGVDMGRSNGRANDLYEDEEREREGLNRSKSERAARGRGKEAEKGEGDELSLKLQNLNVSRPLEGQQERRFSVSRVRKRSMSVQDQSRHSIGYGTSLRLKRGSVRGESALLRTGRDTRPGSSLSIVTPRPLSSLSVRRGFGKELGINGSSNLSGLGGGGGVSPGTVPRLEWLGPRTAKAFRAAGLLDFDRDSASSTGGGASSSALRERDLYLNRDRDRDVYHREDKDDSHHRERSGSLSALSSALSSSSHSSSIGLGRFSSSIQQHPSLSSPMLRSASEYTPRQMHTSEYGHGYNSHTGMMYNSRFGASEYTPRTQSRMAFSDVGGASSGVVESPTFTVSTSTSRDRDTPRSASTAPTSVSGSGSSFGYLGGRTDRDKERERDREEIRELREKHTVETGALLGALSDSQRTVRVLREENAELRLQIESTAGNGGGGVTGGIEDLRMENDDLRRENEELRRECVELSRVAEGLRRELVSAKRSGAAGGVLKGTNQTFRERDRERYGDETYNHDSSTKRSSYSSVVLDTEGDEDSGILISTPNPSLDHGSSQKQHRRKLSTTSSIFPIPPANMTLLLNEDPAGASNGSRSASAEELSSQMSITPHRGDKYQRRMYNQHGDDSSPASPTTPYGARTNGRSHTSPEFIPSHSYSMSAATTAQSNISISPTTANFSMVTGSPGSLFLRPEHEMLLGEMESLDLGMRDEEFDGEGGMFNKDFELAMGRPIGGDTWV